MTVYNNIHHSSSFAAQGVRHQAGRRQLGSSENIFASRVSIINMALASVFILMVFIYVTQINSITSATYHIKTLQNNISSLNETHGSLAAKQSAAEDVVLIYNYAQQNNMIEAGNVSYLFDNGNVALGATKD